MCPLQIQLLTRTAWPCSSQRRHPSRVSVPLTRMLLEFILYFALGKQGALEGTECACVCWGWKSEHATVSGGWTWHWRECTTTRAACSLVIRRCCRWPDAGVPDVVFPGKLPEGTDRPTHHMMGSNGSVVPVCTSLCLMQFSAIACGPPPYPHLLLSRCSPR